MNETGCGVRNEHVAQRVRSDARGILQLARSVTLGAPLTDVLER